MAGQAAAAMTAGGALWELGEAWKLIAAAKQSGTLADEKLGWIRLMEAFNNASSSASAAQLIPMLLELQVIRDERRTDLAHSEHVTGLLLSQATVEQATQAGQDVTLGLHEMRLNLIERAAAVAMIAAELARTEALLVAERVARIEDTHRREAQEADR